jgi:nucleotide-binding universal stress UspA family protein
MKRIVVVFDGLKYSAATEQYAIRLARQNSTHLVAAFLDDSAYHSYNIHELVHEDGVLPTKQRKLNKKDEKTRAAAAAKFEKSCVEAGQQYSIHKSRKVAIQELLDLTSYSDLIIIGKNESFSNRDEEIPSHFIRELLAKAACPVLVVPEFYVPVKKIILLFDGHESSIHAIKMFSYTLDLLKEIPSRILTVKKPGETRRIPDNRLMTEFVNDHYPGSTYSVLKGDAETEIYNFVKDIEGLMIIIGAYNRSRVSRWARPSMADMLLQKTNIPLFIAHQE